MANFDEAVVQHEDGTTERLTHDEFFKLPLLKRVRILTDSRVRFFQDGRLVPAVDAMK
jgi:hypothetical protein